MATSPVPGSDRPNSVPWPPIVQVGLWVVAWLLGHLRALDFLPDVGLLHLFGWALLASGVLLLLTGARYFQSIGTPTDPTGQAKLLADGGVFARTRNPMYLGMTIGMFGLALGLGSSWLLLLSLINPFLLQKLAIEPEEAYLTRRFGADYTAFCKRVPRWI